jgi:LacI family transcriptional regulator, galactose operon repressor
MEKTTTRKPGRKPVGRRGSVTLKQIANEVGVSITTVSRVLSFDTTLSVGDQTRQTIIETAEAMNYEPPRKRRRSEAKGSSGKIALLHFLRPEEELADPYYVSLRLGIESRCAAMQREHVKLYQNDSLLDAEKLNELSGLIVIGWHSEEETRWLQSHNRNIVFADFSPRGDSMDVVLSDLQTATTKLLSALTELGYKRIAFAGWYDRSSRSDEKRLEPRCKTYCDWMKEAGRYEDSLLAIGTNTEESGYRLAKELLSQDNRPDVIVTSNDNMAVGAYRAIHNLGLRIPEDIAVASFNDISAARFLNPPLTTVRLPAEKIGENAVDLLLERLAGRDLAKRVVLESKIVWRGSTRVPPED